LASFVFIEPVEAASLPFGWYGKNREDVESDSIRIFDLWRDEDGATLKTVSGLHRCDRTLSLGLL
jgi:hypothetical protein